MLEVVEEAVERFDEGVGAFLDAPFLNLCLGAETLRPEALAKLGKFVLREIFVEAGADQPFLFELFGRFEFRIVALTGGRPRCHAEGSFRDLFTIDDNVRGTRRFGVHALEIGRCDLERVEGEGGILAIDATLEEKRRDLTQGDLDGVRVLEKREGHEAIGIALAVEVERDRLGTMPEMVVAKLVFFECRRSALDAAGFDVLTTWCIE